MNLLANKHEEHYYSLSVQHVGKTYNFSHSWVRGESSH